ncbi:MAG: universal stress protein [Phycisphaerales bacterium]|nr:universal stress protein [Phycisphaerales bacterium]
MYETILVTLDATVTDRAIISHIKQLAKLCGSKVVLLHVADGWAARQFGPNAVSDEVTEDRAYLANVKKEFEDVGVAVQTELAYGEPRKEILKWVAARGCSLIAMSTHGHRFLGDLFLGATATHVQHRVEVPVLLIKAR